MKLHFPVKRTGQPILTEGHPMVEYESRRILLPFGHKLKAVRLIPGKTGIFKDYYAEPAPIDAPTDTEQPLERKEADSIYKKNAYYPEVLFKAHSVQYKKGFVILPLEIYWQRYNPVKRRLKCFSEYDLIIDTEPAEEERIKLRNIS